jgi:hypothetical protein
MANNFKIKLAPTNQSFTLKNTTVNPARLDNLNDVSEPEAAMVDGAVLVYDADSDTYVLSDIFVKDEDGNYVIQSGSF